MYERKIKRKAFKEWEVSLYIDYYPPVWNPQKKIHTRREFLKLFIYKDPQIPFEKKQNELNREIAEKIFLKRMKSLMLDENNLFNKDVLKGIFPFLQEIMFITRRDQAKMLNIFTAL